MDIFVAIIYLASLFVLWRLLAGARALLRGLTDYDIKQIQEVLKLLNTMSRVAKENGATAIRIEVAAAGVARNLVRAQESVDTVAKDLVVAQAAVDKVANNLHESEKRADAVVDQAHGAAADAASKSGSTPY